MSAPEDPGGGRPPLRVGLFLHSFELPLWARRIVKEVRASPHADLVLVVVDREADRSPKRRRAPALLHRAYVRLDARLFRPEPDAFAIRNAVDDLSGIPALTLTPLPAGERDRYADPDVERIRAFRLDVGLCLRSRPLAGAVPGAAACGVWTLFFGDVDPPGFWEVMEGLPLNASGLRRLADDRDGERILYRSYAAADARSVRRNRNNVYLKTAAFPARKIAEVRERGRDGLATAPPSQAEPAPRPRGSGPPGNLRMIGAFARLASRYAADRLRRGRSLEQWQLAYRWGAGSIEPASFAPLVPPPDRLWADPFPLRAGDRHYIFFEELRYATGRGRIAVLEIDRRGRTSPPSIVLERDHHLSYPFLLEWQGRLYMIPESSENGTVQAYRCESFPDVWRSERVLMSGMALLDPTLVEYGGRWWMFATRAEDGASTWDELHLFHADHPFGPYTPHPRNPVRSDVRTARPAGWIVRENGALIRPAQDCSVRYGYALSRQRIVHLDEQVYEETGVSRITPDAARGILGVHTLNAAGDLAVIDRLVRR